jgi:hypothetical protein
MKQCFREILRDKDGNFSLREVAVALFILVLIISWIGQQFFNKEVPEFMFYAFSSMVAAGCFAYSFERKTKI